MRQLLAAGLLAIGLLPAPPMFTTASDNFPGPDNTTLGTDWIDPEAEFGIVSHAATQRNAGVNTRATAWWNPSTNSFTGNQFSQVTCGTVGANTPPYGSQWCGVGVNMSGSSFATTTGYLIYGSHSNPWQLVRRDAGGAEATLASGSYSAADGDVFYLEHNGSLLTFKLNGTSVGTASDSTYVGGQPGLNVDAILLTDAVAFTSWSGGDLGGGAVFPAAIINGAPVRGGGRNRR
jgi:hypothetical protein